MSGRIEMNLDVHKELRGKVYHALLNAPDPVTRVQLAYQWLGALMREAVHVAAMMHGLHHDAPPQYEAMEELTTVLRKHFPLLPESQTEAHIIER